MALICLLQPFLAPAAGVKHHGEGGDSIMALVCRRQRPTQSWMAEEVNPMKAENGMTSHGGGAGRRGHPLHQAWQTSSTEYFNLVNERMDPSNSYIYIYILHTTFRYQYI